TWPSRPENNPATRITVRDTEYHATNSIYGPPSEVPSRLEGLPAELGIHRLGSALSGRFSQPVDLERHPHEGRAHRRCVSVAALAHSRARSDRNGGENNTAGWGKGDRAHSRSEPTRR